jgi:hypothetical protein
MRERRARKAPLVTSAHSNTTSPLARYTRCCVYVVSAVIASECSTTSVVACCAPTGSLMVFQDFGTLTIQRELANG